MKLEEIKNKTKDAVEYLVKLLDSGHSEVLAEYLSAMARFRTYSFGNIHAHCTPEVHRLPLACGRRPILWLAGLPYSD